MAIIKTKFSGNWHDINTWDLKRIPDENDDVIVNSNHSIYVGSNVYVKSMTIDNEDFSRLSSHKRIRSVIQSDWNKRKRNRKLKAIEEL